jgi:formylmethanofuran dehydrogenase subunit A
MIVQLSQIQCCDGIVDSTAIRDLFMVDGYLAKAIPKGSRVDAHYCLPGHVVLPGGVDIHTHIGGGKVNVARLLLPERSARDEQRIQSETKPWLAPLSCPVPNTWETGRRYLQMGYTTCFEPAMLPAGARHAHAEMRDTPWLDTGGYVLLGNERMLLQWIADGVPQPQITDYVAWMLRAHAACAVKVVNAGGIDAFKFNQRHMQIDEKHPIYGISPRQILRALSTAVTDLGLAHPLHVHCSNLGKAGNIAATLATVDAVEGRRLHLAHAQYHCYGAEGPHGYSSAAHLLADRVNGSDRLTIDVGQVLFGQTITLSADTMHQFGNRKLASPRKTVFQDIECQAGCGALPFRYRQSQYVHSLQWSIGLELFLRIRDPRKVFLTTDHPNGGPFTGYPHLIRLLMDYDFRMSIFEQLHPDVRRTSPLPELKREYTLDEIATSTRSGPAAALGLVRRGTLEHGALADLAVYRIDSDPESMFRNPTMVFRRGKLVYRDGVFLDDCDKTTIVADMLDSERAESWVSRPEHQLAWHARYGYSPTRTAIRQDELISAGRLVEENQRPAP